MYLLNKYSYFKILELQIIYLIYYLINCRFLKTLYIYVFNIFLLCTFYYLVIFHLANAT